MLCVCWLWLARMHFGAMSALLLQQLLEGCSHVNHAGLVSGPAPIPSLISHCFGGFLGPPFEHQGWLCPSGHACLVSQHRAEHLAGFMHF